MPRRDGNLDMPVSLGGTSAVCLFVLILLGFVVESQLTQYVQTDLGFRQPYLIFYIVHSFFALMFPVHFLFLVLSSQHSAKAIWAGLMFGLTRHVSPAPSGRSNSVLLSWGFVRFALFFTAGMTVPALLWFIAMSLAPVTDVTALWNTNAFFAYVIAVKMFKLEWEARRLIAVMLATCGALAVIYGGSNSADVAASTDRITRAAATKGTPAPLIGDLLTFIASVVYALYQVLYKKYAALPSDPEVQADGIYAPILPSEETDPEGESIPPKAYEDMVYPPPFALYPNLITTAIGICTFCFLWIPIPILHFTGAEPFHLPSNFTTVLAIGGIIMGGVVFNAGFMVLLGVWGPIVTSVGNLLTIVLVFISDAMFGPPGTISFWSLLGCGSIVAAFGILAFDVMRER